jgi:hypothetical protein
MNNIWQKLKEDQGNDLEAIPLTKEHLLDLVKGAFYNQKSFQNSQLSSEYLYILPNGKFLGASSPSHGGDEECYADGHTNVDMFLYCKGIIKNKPSDEQKDSPFFEDITGSIKVFYTDYENTEIHLWKNKPTPGQYNSLKFCIRQTEEHSGSLKITVENIKKAAEFESGSFSANDIIKIIDNFYKTGTINFSKVKIKEEIENDGLELADKTFYYPSQASILKDNMFDDESPINSIRVYFTKIVVEPGTDSLSSFEFSNFENVTEVVLPDSLKEIRGFGTFSGCKSLVSITIPKSVIKIGNDYTFLDCTSLKSITILGNVGKISEGTFKGCKSLKTVILPERLKQIGKIAFQDCKSLKSLDLPESLNTIRDYAFDGSGIESLNLPDFVGLYKDALNTGDATKLKKITWRGKTYNSVKSFMKAYNEKFRDPDSFNNEDLKEDQGDDLQVISLTKETILKIVKEEFTSDDSRPEDADSYLLPDGTFIEMFNDIEIYEKNKDYITNPSQTYQHKHVDLFLKSIDVTISISPSNMSRSLFFERITGSIAMYTSPYDEDAVIYLNKNEPTEKQYEALSDFISEALSEDSKLIIKKPDNKVVSQKELQDLTEIEIVNLIKSFYRPGSIKEEIDHEKVYDSLTFSNEPDKGPIFISDDGMFVNLGKLSFHSKIFGGEDYEADDYYFLNDEYDLIKANGGNRFEPFAYIDLWEIPNPAQKKAIISWMYYLIEWGMYTLQVNTSNSNETYSLTNKIPEEVYEDIIRNI